MVKEMLDILDIFELNGEQYKVLENNDHYVVVNSKNMALVAISDPADAKERLKSHLKRCEYYLNEVLV